MSVNTAAKSSDPLMKPPVAQPNRSQMCTAPSQGGSQMMSKTPVSYIDATTTSSVSSTKSGKVAQAIMMSKRSLIQSGRKSDENSVAARAHSINQQQQQTGSNHLADAVGHGGDTAMSDTEIRLPTLGKTKNMQQKNDQLKGSVQ